LNERSLNEHRTMSWIALAAGCLALAGSAVAGVAQGAQPAPAEKESATRLTLPPVPKALLPAVFDGWVEAGAPARFGDAAQADAANAAVLREYGFAYGVQASYKREGETLTLRALHFQDVSGAYGAYSYYRPNLWAREDIGTGAASDKDRAIFWKGDTVVQAKFSRVGPMSAGEMREIAAQLPAPEGNKAVAPPILAFLPQGPAAGAIRGTLEGQTTHYAEGPAGYAGAGGVLPPSLVDFDRGAEAVTANYQLTSGPATLTILEYPTPQIATAQEAAIRAYLKAGSKAQPPWPAALTGSDQASLEVRSSGVLVALVSGDAIPDDSHKLVEMVHYEANLTSIPGGGESEVTKTGQLLMGIASLVLVGSIAAILLGFFLGWGRALYRIARGRPASTLYDEEFIHLDLREEWRENRPPSAESHPKG
jgi:hypothetical protein